jgi:hypothetical protein
MWLPFPLAVYIVCNIFRKRKYKLLTNIRQLMLNLKHILASMIYFNSDMSKSTNTVVYFDWKTVIYIYACGKCRLLFFTIIHSDFKKKKKQTEICKIKTLQVNIVSNMTSFFRFSWKPEAECVASFNMDWRILLVFHPEPEARDKIY